MKSTLCIIALVGCLSGDVGAEVTSVWLYSAGTYYREVFSLALPLSSFHYRVTERKQYQTFSGQVIIDVGREVRHGGVLRRFLDVEFGSGSFSIPLDPGAP